MPRAFSSFREFYPFYLSQHRHPVCRALHVMGVLCSAATLILGCVTHTTWLLLVAPLVGYAFGWTGHFGFEKNRPASFRHPFYSFAGDVLMAVQVLSGRLTLHETAAP